MLICMVCDSIHNVSRIEYIKQGNRRALINTFRQVSASKSTWIDDIERSPIRWRIRRQIRQITSYFGIFCVQNEVRIIAEVSCSFRHVAYARDFKKGLFWLEI